MFAHYRFETLGGANHGWLNAKHHFSFASYHDPEKMCFGELMVINDDIIQPHTGFDTHPPVSYTHLTLPTILLV